MAPTSDNTRLTAFLDHMRKILVCGLYPRSFRAESASEDELLERDGSNFTAWYHLETSAVEGGLKLSELVARGWER